MVADYPGRFILMASLTMPDSPGDTVTLTGGGWTPQETVTVTSEVPPLNVTDPNLGQTIDRKRVDELPSVHGDPYHLMNLTPGVAYTGSTRLDRPFEPTHIANFAMSGARGIRSDLLIDGAPSTATANANEVIASYVPTTDATQEFKVQTATYDAQFGNTEGGVTSIVTKGGTNDFHGAAYYFNRNSALAANTFENNARGIPRPVFNRHQLGGAVGGPILRDKLFFYAAIEPILVRSSATLSYYVPTPELLAVSSAGTNAMFRRFPVPSNLSQTDVSIRTVCPFGRFCGSTINSGFVTIPAFASTTRTGPVDAGAGVPQDTQLWTGRLDYTLNERSTLNVRYAFQDANQFATVTQPYSAELDQPFNVQNQNITLNLTHFLSGNFFTESRAVFSRLFQQSPAAPATEFPSFTITGDTDSVAGNDPVLAARGAWAGIFRVDLDGNRVQSRTRSYGVDLADVVERNHGGEVYLKVIGATVDSQISYFAASGCRPR
jgi:hypothetical protein